MVLQPDRGIPRSFLEPSIYSSESEFSSDKQKIPCIFMLYLIILPQKNFRFGSIRLIRSMVYYPTTSSTISRERTKVNCKN